MWTRESIKTYAKDFLREHYWKAFLVCLIVSLLTGGNGRSNNGKDNYNKNYNNGINYYNNYDIDEGITDKIIDGASEIALGRWSKSFLLNITSSVFPIVAVLLLIILVTIGYALEVGKARFFLQGFKGNARVGNLFSTFNSEEYIGIIKVQLIRYLYNFLWSLLLIIPGIIKSYEYSMVPYIISEQPNLSPNEAIRRSRYITQGHKKDMFILDISFWGWYILGSLFFGIGALFVDPYKEATLARLYNILSGNSDMGTY